MLHSTLQIFVIFFCVFQLEICWQENIFGWKLRRQLECRKLLAERGDEHSRWLSLCGMGAIFSEKQIKAEDTDEGKGGRRVSFGFLFLLLLRASFFLSIHFTWWGLKVSLGGCLWDGETSLLCAWTIGEINSRIIIFCWLSLANTISHPYKLAQILCLVILSLMKLIRIGILFIIKQLDSSFLSQ